jgi:hypothetical protein
MSFDHWRRTTASILILAVFAFAVGSPVLADSSAVFSGKVFQSESTTPKPGVVVTLVDPDSEKSFSSEPTNDEGSFRLDTAPAGSYMVVAETSDGAYLAADAVELSSGDNRPVALTLTGAAPNYQSSPGTSGQQQNQLPTWAKWTIVGGIAVLALLAIDSVTSDEEKTSSPF